MLRFTSVNKHSQTTDKSPAGSSNKTFKRMTEPLSVSHTNWLHQRIHRTC